MYVLQLFSSLSILKKEALFPFCPLLLFDDHDVFAQVEKGIITGLVN